ncbi:WxcM-like domain-containing protein [Pseudoalteromonas sp. MMG013]|uniref:sugar 3,4-ketoisomerase n=1 Tax=Pseudoalteromonas sp. MMG013 TaxID=2822687 RepID=UPI001B3787BB|nr:FdtA/QdtA family cupin domain-containing protein [Pseudoalteromonas sp. MMG013]MBQ4860865.1 WxcM-like domain-containing protein [Pseudoalteromonas sp. MMG013]
MSLITVIDFPSLGDHRGGLIVLEADDHNSVPFEIKRVYYIFDVTHGESRGFHAHKNLTQVAICVAGSCKFKLDDGKAVEYITLDSPSKGLLISSMTWREMHDFSDDCVLLVLASEHYDESDYIRNYDEFITAARETK